MKWSINVFVVAVIFLSNLTGCASRLDNKAVSAKQNVKAPSVNHSLYQQGQVTIPSAAEIFALSPAQQQIFVNFYKQQVARGEDPHIALYNFLSKKLANFTYYGETLIAEQAMRLNKGNCMSLAILTTALANLVDLKVDYREVESMPIFEKKNNLLLSSKHVQAIVYNPLVEEDSNVLYFVKPSIIIDYFPSASNRVVSGIIKSSLIARYYINLSAKYLTNNDINNAFLFAQHAYQFDKKSADIINLLGVLHRRAGDQKSAEDFYRYGLSQQPNNVDLVKNYLVLLWQQDRDEDITFYENQVASLYDPNPYSWLKQAYNAQKQRRMKKAEQYYLKTIENAPYLQEAYLGLYRLYLDNGRTSKAIKTLEKALPWAHDDQHKQRYQAKLFSLTNGADVDWSIPAPEF